MRLALDSGPKLANRRPMVEKQKDNIVLIGAMGCGKSSVGQLLARRLRLQFFETDRIVEARAKMDLKDLIAQRGESFLRSRETAALEALKIRHGRYVLGTSSGIVSQPRNLALLRSLGWVVLLKGEPDELFRRVSEAAHRPIFKLPDPRARYQEMLDTRQPLYAQAAHSTLDTTTLSVNDVVERIATVVPKVFERRPARNRPVVDDAPAVLGVSDAVDIVGNLLDLF